MVELYHILTLPAVYLARIMLTRLTPLFWVLHANFSVTLKRWWMQVVNSSKMENQIRGLVIWELDARRMLPVDGGRQDILRVAVAV